MMTVLWWIPAGHLPTIEEAKEKPGTVEPEWSRARSVYAAGDVAGANRYSR